MSMSALVRVLGAAAGGAANGMRAAEEEARRKKKDAQEEEDRAFAIAERNRATKMRDDMAAAAAPVEVQQVEQAGPVLPGAEGAAGKPLAPVARVQGVGYDSPELAARAAQASNAPMAVAVRMADVAARGGDPVKAQQLRTGAMQEQASKYQLNTAERADLDAKFNDQVDSRVNDFDSLGRFLSDSAADGAGGKVKMQMLPSADGKSIVAHVVMPDGSLKPTEKQWPNTPAGFLEAKELLKKTAPERKLAHLFNQAQLAQQAARDKASAEHQAAVLKETGRHNTTMEGIAKDKTAAQVEIAGMRAALARGGGGGAAGGAGVATPWDAAADTFLRQRYTTTDPAGQVFVDGGGLQFAKAIALAQAQRNGGDTTSALGMAFEADAKIHAEAKGDPAAIAAARRQLLTRLMAPAPQPAPAPAAKAAEASPVSAKPSMLSRAVQTANGASPMVDSREALALDAARSATRAAHDKFMAYGSAQRARDPQGFNAAQQAYASAKAQEKAASDAYVATIASPTAARMARP